MLMLKSVFILRRRADGMPLSYSECAHSTDGMRHFVVGFPTPSMARRVMRSMHPVKPCVRLYHRRSGLQEEVRRPAPGENVSAVLQLDPYAQLHVPKRAACDAPNIRSRAMEYDVSHMHADEFISLPAVRSDQSVGIIIPYRVAWEDAQELVLTSSVLNL